MILHSGPHRTLWNQPRPRRWPPRPAARPFAGKRWPVDPQMRGADLGDGPTDDRYGGTPHDV